MKRLLELVKTRVRGILGLGVVTGAIGYVVGAVWTLVTMTRWPALLRDPDVWQILAENAGYIVTTTLWYGFVWAIPAGLIGSAFAGVLAIGEADKRLDQLRLWKMAVMGAAVGAAVPVLSTLYVGGIGLLTGTLGFVAGEAGLLATAGAVLSVGLVSAAKRAERDELAIVDEVAALAAPAAD